VVTNHTFYNARLRHGSIDAFTRRSLTYTRRTHRPFVFYSLKSQNPNPIESRVWGRIKTQT